MNNWYLALLYYFPLLILLLGSIFIVLFTIFSNYFTRTFTLYYGKMRILYGYIVFIFVGISYAFCFYYFGLFSARSLLIGTFRITPFNSMIFTALTITIIIFNFNAIQQCENVHDKISLPFVGILAIQSGIYLITFSISSVSIFVGLFVMIFGVTVYLIFTFETKKHENRNLLSSITKNNAIFLGLMMIGFSAHYVRYGTFNIFTTEQDKGFLAILSFTFILAATLLLMGVWPFQSFCFGSLSTRFPSYPFILNIIKRTVAFLLLIKYSLTFNYHPFKEAMTWLFIIIAIANLLISSIATVTEHNIQHLFIHLSLVQSGVIILTLAQVLQDHDSQLISSASFALCYNICAYVLIFTFAFASINNFVYKFKTSDIKTVIGIGRKDLPIFLAILFSLLFATVFPFSVGFFAKEMVINLFAQTTKIYFVIILFFVFVFILVPIVRFAHYAFMEIPTEKHREYFVELGVTISALLSFIMIVGVTILSSYLLTFFSKMVLFFPFT